MIPSKDRRTLQAFIGEARTTLGQVTFAVAYDEGQDMTLEQALAFALGQ